MQMATKEEMHEFATYWLAEYFNAKTTEIKIGTAFAEMCLSLGFQTYDRRSFEKVFPDPDAFNDDRSLSKMVGQMNDAELLGSAIFSKWRQTVHELSLENTFSLERQSWFVIALSRMALLTSEEISDPYIFGDKVKRIRIVSGPFCWGLRPGPTVEVEQRLTIAADGRVWFSGYHYGENYGGLERGRTNNFGIGKQAAAHILSAAGKYFSNDHVIIDALDCGLWEMDIVNSKGRVYHFRGSLCADLFVNGVGLSDLIRDTLCMQALFVFDGNTEPDRVDRIVIDYCRDMKNKSACLVSEQSNEVICGYSEQLIIDRAANTLELIQNIGSGRTVAQKYTLEKEVAGFLDELDAEDLFDDVPGGIDAHDETKNYRITVDFQKQPQLVLTGTYGKHGLPADWADFTENILSLIHDYGMSEILDPAIYDKIKRIPSEYIYCSVSFNDDSSVYYYQTEDESIDAGDRVIVPAGPDNAERIAIVKRIDYYEADKVPFSLEKTKQIIGKWTEEEES
jgi:hypothetical protein